MSGQKRLPVGAEVFLLVVALTADGAKFLLDLMFGIGLVVDPFFITPVTTGIFWITMSHNGVSMFSGTNWAAAWANELVSLTPGVDGLPDWTAYTIYLIVNNHASNLTQGIIS